MYLVSEFAAKYFQDVMQNTEEGKAIGYSYFKERGFTFDTIKKFGLGYSPEGWEAFSKEALGKGYQLEFLESTGLTIVREDGKLADRFRGRVMFPIQSMSGRVLGFGGRILSSDKKVAKYLNSPESEIYHKSKVLYGIYHAKQAIAKQDNCYLVEGYTDVIQFNQAGIENVVSSSGTALTPDQIRLVNRLTKNITVLFDGDAAGLRASVRGIDLILEEGMNVKVCTFPNGEDPDSFARKNTHEQLVSYLESNSKDFIQFKASLLVEEAANDPIKKADTIRDMVTSISKIKDMIKREIYLKETSRIMDISEEILRNTLAQLHQKDIAEAGKKLKQITADKAFDVVRNDTPETVEKIDVFKLLQREIIKILLIYGNFVEEFEDVLIKTNSEGEIVNEIEKRQFKVSQRVYLNLQEDEVEFADALFKDIYIDLVNKLLQNEELKSEEYLKDLNEAFIPEITDILMEEEQYTLDNWESRQIIVKTKQQNVAHYVTETIVSLREY